VLRPGQQCSSYERAQFNQQEGYQLALALAFLIGMASTYSFSRLHDPAEKTPSDAPPPLHFLNILKDLKKQSALLALIGTAVVWNFFLNIRSRLIARLFQSKKFRHLSPQYQTTYHVVQRSSAGKRR
jgi:hypothetical protein